MPDNIELDLYRSCKKGDWGSRNATNEQRSERFMAAEGETAMHPNYGFRRRDGSFRPSDVTRFEDDNGQIWVHGVNDVDSDGKHWVSPNEGVSLAKNRQAMPYADGWFDFLLPKGTPIPASLDVKHTPTRSNPDHYSVRLKNQMTQEAYQGALDNLARNAIAKAVELKTPSLYFS